MRSIEQTETLFVRFFPRHENGLLVSDDSIYENYAQANSVPSDNWIECSEEKLDKRARLFEFKKNWYLE